MRCLEPDPHARRIPLVLRNRKLAGVCQLVRRVTTQEQPSSDWFPADAGLIRVAQITGEASPTGNLQTQLFTDDPCARTRDWETDARIQQDIVIRIVAKITTEHIRVEPQLP